MVLQIFLDVRSARERPLFGSGIPMARWPPLAELPSFGDARMSGERFDPQIFKHLEQLTICLASFQKTPPILVNSTKFHSRLRYPHSHSIVLIECNELIYLGKILFILKTSAGRTDAHGF